MDKQQAIEGALYLIDRIRPEIEQGNFRGVYRYTQHLELLTKYAAIAEERQNVGIPIIKFPE